MRLLILYHAGFTYTPAIFHYLDAFRQHSLHKVEFFNVDQHYREPLDFSNYDCVFINFCVASVARVPEPPRFLRKLVLALWNYSGLKIAAVQDEYDFTNRVKRFFRDIQADAILTNVPLDRVRQVYPEPEFSGVHFETVATAYLSEDLFQTQALPLAKRDIPLGYRGRELPYRLGDLAWHKSEVGRRLKVACLDRGIECDIEVDEKSRFHGDDWLNFVRRCRVMLGTQSGANVFDYDGSLHERIKARYLSSPGLRYEDVRDEVLAHDVGFDMGQVSARIFEAAASRTALALVRGFYSGVVEPDEHYVPIEPDYSNIDQVLDRVQDVNAMQEMADRAYAYVVGNLENRYSSLVERVDRIVYNASRTGHAQSVGGLTVTRCPLGTDPYLNERLREARQDARDYAQNYRDLVSEIGERRAEVVPYHDGTFRILKNGGTHTPPSH